MSARRDLARTAGALAVGLSVLWAIGASAAIAVGTILFFSKADDTSIDLEGLAHFVGGSIAVIGALCLLAAIAGIVLGVKMRRGTGRSRLAPVALFTVLALVSGMFLASSFADKTGVNVWGVVLFGINTALCVAVAGAALVSPRP